MLFKFNNNCFKNHNETEIEPSEHGMNVLNSRSESPDGAHAKDEQKDC